MATLSTVDASRHMFERQRDAYLALPFERVTDPAVARAILLLSAFFALDFQRNALTALRFALDMSLETPARNERILHVMMELVGSECCTTNILGESYGVTSHFYPAIEAARQCGQDVEPLLQLARHEDSSALPADWQEFWQFQKRYLSNKSACFAVIGHCRELLLSNVFERLATHLPRTEAFEIGRQFFERHVVLDTAEGNGHADLMRLILDAVITDTTTGYAYATEFLTRRNALYAQALGVVNHKDKDVTLKRPHAYASVPVK